MLKHGDGDDGEVGTTVHSTALLHFFLGNDLLSSLVMTARIQNGPDPFVMAQSMEQMFAVVTGPKLEEISKVRL